MQMSLSKAPNIPFRANILLVHASKGTCIYYIKILYEFNNDVKQP